jgi:hypothetical protein
MLIEVFVIIEPASLLILRPMALDAKDIHSFIERKLLVSTTLAVLRNRWVGHKCQSPKRLKDTMTLPVTLICQTIYLLFSLSLRNL